MDNNKPRPTEEQVQQANEVYQDLVERAKGGDANAALALMLLNAVGQQSAWAEALGKTRQRRVTGMELRDIGMLQPTAEAKIDINAPLLEDFELTHLGKYFGNAEKGVLVQVIPDEPTRYIHEAPRGLQ